MQEPTWVSSKSKKTNKKGVLSDNNNKKKTSRASLLPSGVSLSVRQAVMEKNAKPTASTFCFCLLVQMANVEREKEQGKKGVKRPS